MTSYSFSQVYTFWNSFHFLSKHLYLSTKLNLWFLLCSVLQWFRVRMTGEQDDLDIIVEKTLWFSNMLDNEPVDLRTDSKYSGRVKHLCDKNSCFLRITDLRQRDSAVYRFRFMTNHPGGRFTGSPGVNLTVTDLKVKVIQTSYSSYWMTLRCKSSCHLPGQTSIIWYKNNKKIKENTELHYSDYIYSQDSFSCAIKGLEDFPSPPVCEFTVFHYALKVPSVSVSPQSEIMEGSSVTLTCNSDAQSAVNYTWYKKNQTLLNKEPQLVFSSIQSSDSGEFYCSAENELGKKTSPYININIVEGSSVTLTCSSDANPAANYTWYKGNQTIHHGPEGIYRFNTSIRSKDKGPTNASLRINMGTSPHLYL
uniref:B-cell receptor CD22 n=1 Tax=Anabas testudineus TaxID=64144 RepID=A0A3Q1H8D6_ANATE